LKKPGVSGLGIFIIVVIVVIAIIVIASTTFKTPNSFPFILPLVVCIVLVFILRSFPVVSHLPHTNFQVEQSDIICFVSSGPK
jgi:hypothetical protein